MIASGGQRVIGPDLHPLDEQQPLGLRNSSTWSPFQGTAIVVWSGS